MNREIFEVSCLFTSTSVMKGVKTNKASWAAVMSSFCSRSRLGRAESGGWRENITSILWCERIVSKGPRCGTMIHSKHKLDRSLSKHASQLKLAHNSRVYLGRRAESPWHTVPAVHWKANVPQEVTWPSWEIPAEDIIGVRVTVPCELFHWKPSNEKNWAGQGRWWFIPLKLVFWSLTKKF